MIDPTMGRLPGVIFPSDTGPRNSDTLQAVLTALSTQPATLVLDAGTWTISDDITLPETLTVVMLQGAVFDVVSGATLTVDCTFHAGVEQKFSSSDNSGIVTTQWIGEGVTARFPFRVSEWADTEDFDSFTLGEGYLTAGDVDISNYMATAEQITAGESNALAVSPFGLYNAVFRAAQVPSHDSLNGVPATQPRRIHVSSGVPSGGQDGDIWFQYA